jgi:hypothetical protein
VSRAQTNNIQYAFFLQNGKNKSKKGTQETTTSGTYLADIAQTFPVHEVSTKIIYIAQVEKETQKTTNKKSAARARRKKKQTKNSNRAQICSLGHTCNCHAARKVKIRRTKDRKKKKAKRKEKETRVPDKKGSSPCV